MRGAAAPTQTSTIHAAAVLIGPKAALIRGGAGAGKSQLALALVEAARIGGLPFARLVGDDRVHVEASAGRLLVRPAKKLAGLLEVRGLGIRHLPYEPVAVVGLVVDLAAADADRQPAREATEASIEGIVLPRLAVAPGTPALPLVLAFLNTAPTCI
jgi:serine kinase of HPr protein (carbohydrate metabolism regulator)